MDLQETYPEPQGDVKVQATQTTANNYPKYITDLASGMGHVAAFQRHGCAPTSSPVAGVARNSGVTARGHAHTDGQSTPSP